MPIQFSPEHEGIRDQGQPTGPHSFHRFTSTKRGLQAERPTSMTRNAEAQQLIHLYSDSVRVPNTTRTREDRSHAKLEQSITTETLMMAHPSSSCNQGESHRGWVTNLQEA